MSSPAQQAHFYYEIVDRIGSGTFGIVYKAKETETGNLVAIKCTNEGMDDSSLKYEIDVMQKIEHENILRFISFHDILINGVGNPQAVSMMVTEFCVCDLRTILSKCPTLRYGVIRSISNDILKALVYLESIKILHCDIKPENILLSAEGRMKLCDFGAARNVWWEQDYSDCFTREYCPPEALVGATKLNSTADAWSFACVFVELFIGKRLFPVGTKFEMLQRIFKLCGSPHADFFLNVGPTLRFGRKCQLLSSFKRQVPEKLSPKINDDLAMSAIDKLLVVDPSHRWKCSQMKQSPYFNGEHSPLEELVHIMGFETLGDEDDDEEIFDDEDMSDDGDEDMSEDEEIFDDEDEEICDDEDEDMSDDGDEDISDDEEIYAIN